MGPIIALIITVIGNNIALSIGLGGSLSIIRFRTVIKDSRDLIFLLWGIAVGLGAGTENWVPISVASAALGMTIVFVHMVKYGQNDRRELVLVVSGNRVRYRAISRNGLRFLFCMMVKNTQRKCVFVGISQRVMPP